MKKLTQVREALEVVVVSGRGVKVPKFGVNQVVCDLSNYLVSHGGFYVPTEIKLRYIVIYPEI